MLHRLLGFITGQWNNDEMEGPSDDIDNPNISEENDIASFFISSQSSTLSDAESIRCFCGRTLDDFNAAERRAHINSHSQEQAELLSGLQMKSHTDNNQVSHEHENLIHQSSESINCPICKLSLDELDGFLTEEARNAHVELCILEQADPLRNSTENEKTVKSETKERKEEIQQIMSPPRINRSDRNKRKFGETTTESEEEITLSSKKVKTSTLPVQTVTSAPPLTPEQLERSQMNKEEALARRNKSKLELVSTNNHNLGTTSPLPSNPPMSKMSSPLPSIGTGRRQEVNLEAVSPPCNKNRKIDERKSSESEQKITPSSMKVKTIISPDITPEQREIMQKNKEKALKKLKAKEEKERKAVSLTTTNNQHLASTSTLPSNPPMVPNSSSVPSTLSMRSKEEIQQTTSSPCNSGLANKKRKNDERETTESEKEFTLSSKKVKTTPSSVQTITPAPPLSVTISKRNETNSASTTTNNQHLASTSHLPSNPSMAPNSSLVASIPPLLPGGKYLYVIKLTEGKYYVGTSKDIYERLEAHRSGNGGAAWTRKFKPLDGDAALVMLYVIEGGSLDESHETERLMRIHGIDNVRGGDYVKVDLDPEVKQRLIRRFREADGKCLNCGELGHYINECDVEIRNNTTAVLRCFVCGQKNHTERNCPNHSTRAPQPQSKSTPVCYRCGRDTHFISDCFASKDVNGKKISDDSSLSFQVPPNAPAAPAPKYHSNKTSRKISDSSISLACHRCGRDGHFEKDCYATTVVNGRSSSDNTSLRHSMRAPAYGRPSNNNNVNNDNGHGNRRNIRECSRCGRGSHYANNCNAEFHIDGRRL